MSELPNTVPLWLWGYDPVLATMMSVTSTQYFNYFAGLAAGSSLITGGLLLHNGLNPLEKRRVELAMGGMLVSITTLPLIRTQLEEIPFILGLFTPGSIISLFLGLVGLGFYRDASSTFREARTSFHLLRDSMSSAVSCSLCLLAHFEMKYYFDKNNKKNSAQNHSVLNNVNPRAQSYASFGVARPSSSHSKQRSSKRRFD